MTSKLVLEKINTQYSLVLLTLGLVLLFFLRKCHSADEVLDSVMETLPGHYPPNYCRMTNIVLKTTDGNLTFLYKGDYGAPKFTGDIWPMEQVTDMFTQCDRRFKVGLAYTIFYWAGNSNYYHLTYDMLIPLYKHFYMSQMNEAFGREDVAFMPTVETSRLQALDAKSSAFDNSDAYWVKMSEFIAREFLHMPLNKQLVNQGHNICFDEIYFGTTKVNYRDADLIKTYVRFIKNKMDIEETHPKTDRMVLVSRKGRRKILNEEEVVESLQDIIPTDLLEFQGMSFEEQVKSVQNYTVFAALNGAGLMNSLYLPEHAVAIQMVPYKAGLNVKQYGDLIKGRGPYMEWHNTHEELHFPAQGDKYNNRPDTKVHIGEFQEFVKKAVEASKQAHLASIKTEL